MDAADCFQYGNQKLRQTSCLPEDIDKVVFLFQFNVTTSEYHWSQISGLPDMFTSLTQ